MDNFEEKSCHAHSDRDSVTSCSWCGKSLCNECIVKSKEKELCSDCARAIGLDVKIIEPLGPPEKVKKPKLKPVMEQQTVDLGIKKNSLPFYMVLGGLVGTLLISIGAGLYYFCVTERFSINHLLITDVLSPVLWLIVSLRDILLTLGFFILYRKWSDRFLVVASISWGLNIVWRYLYPTPWSTLIGLSMYTDSSEFLSIYPEWFILAHLTIVSFIISGIAFLRSSSKFSKNTFTKTTGYVLVLGSFLYLITDFILMLRIPNVAYWIFPVSDYVWAIPYSIAHMPLLLLQVVCTIVLLPIFAAHLGFVNLDSLRVSINSSFPFFIFIGFGVICFGIILDGIALMNRGTSFYSIFFGPIGALFVFLGGLLSVRYREVTGEVQLKQNFMKERVSFLFLLLGIVLFWIGMLSFLYYIPGFSFTSLGEISGLTLMILAGYLRRSLHVSA